MLPNLIFVDTETTGLGPEDRLIQLAFTTNKGELLDMRFNPGRPISFEAMAVHHVTEEMVKGLPAFKGSQAHEDLVARLENHIFVAHNAPFDLRMLEREGIPRPKLVIDTQRVARHIVTSEDRHALQYLRYALGINTDIIQKHPEINAHDALSDVYVLEGLFSYLLDWCHGEDEKEKVKKMIELSATPVLMRKFTFGKHMGKTFDEVRKEDRGYLCWLRDMEKMKPVHEQNEDLMYTLKFYLNI